MDKQEFLKSRVGGINDITVTDLVLFAVNDGDLYRQTKRYIDYNMGKYFKAGEFDIHKSAIIYKSFMDIAAKKYCREFGDMIFTSAEKWAAAYQMAENNLIEMEAGNFTESRS